MAKNPRKTTKIESNAIYNILSKEKVLPKSRQQIYKENYQKNKERKKTQRKQRYQQQKEQAELTTKQNLGKIKVLMSLKEYTELSKDKRKLWLDFVWTLQECKEGITNITAIMKLEEVANNLVRDYWTTAKSEVRQKSKSWNNLDYDEQ